MGRRNKTTRVLGPYEDRGDREPRWRTVVVDERGRRTTFSDPTEKEAKERVKAARKVLAIETAVFVAISEAVEAFIDYKVERQFWDRRTVERRRRPA